MTKIHGLTKSRRKPNLNPIKKTKMTQTVHDNFINSQNLQATAGFGNNKRRFFLTFLVALVTYAGMAQTYTTKADGNWNSTATWVGGVVPTPGAGKIINIKHDVTYNLTTDLAISGTINIEGDTLRFPNTYNKKISVAANGILNVKNGGFLHSVQLGASPLEIAGGRVYLENAKLTIPLTFTATAGSKRTYRNSTVEVGGAYSVEGTSAARAIDTIQNSTISVSIRTQSDFLVKAYATVHVANAKIVVANKGSFKTEANTDVKVLPGAAGNYGFSLLKIDESLDANGAWDARIDAFCIGKDVKGNTYADVDFTRPEDCSAGTSSTPAPELSFVNPVLKSGSANKEGAVYRFSNVTTGVDAEIKMKKFSRNDIVMKAFDNPTLGWNKAFQPEFGLPGVVQPNQNWYIDFEMVFYEAGTNKRKKIQKADFTALDVDGDGYSISEYAVFSNPANVSYSTTSALASLPAGSLGSSILCGTCNVASVLIQCNVCQGSGQVNDLDCNKCSGHGTIHSGCSHAYQGLIGNVLQGPVQNFANIDTNGTAVMATYQYTNVDRVNFRYGAKSGLYASNGSGIRLNSMWSKSFALTPWTVLPVSFSSFNVTYEKGDANLSWSAPVSDKLSGFVVQRSTDGNNFTDIATVFAGTRTSYTYTDNGVASASGVVYYRIVSVDYTKEANYSTIRMIRLAKSEAATVSLLTYPNPVVNDVRITLPNTWQGKPVMLQLYTSAGVIAKTIQLGSASQTELMQLNGLSKGMYVVKAICGEETAQQRIVKN